MSITQPVGGSVRLDRLIDEREHGECEAATEAQKDT
jgi:hypothetical protein